MMPPEEGRERKRRSAERIPLKLRCLATRGVDYFEATIRNACENGVYIECDCCMRPGERVRIHLLEEATEEFRYSEINESTGVIRWCKSLSPVSGRRWGAGIRLS
ncbi:MAG TPA: hypothetical protein PKW43_11580 [Deltaproteobacteria bacterium]|jgi:hypothetical protein|nr:hypothetical protein [Deltaproteobacteria bacterium]